VIQQVINRAPIATSIIQDSAVSRYVISEDVYVQWMSERLFPGH